MIPMWRRSMIGKFPLPFSQDPVIWVLCLLVLIMFLMSDYWALTLFMIFLAVIINGVKYYAAKNKNR